MASIVERGGKHWAVRIGSRDPDGTEHTRWHALGDVANKKQAVKAVGDLTLAQGEEASLSTLKQRDTKRFFVKYTTTVDGKKTQVWRVLPGVADMDEAISKKRDVEKALAEGRDPFPPAVATTAPESMATFFMQWAGTGKPLEDEHGKPVINKKTGAELFDLGTLTNRNASNDRAIVHNHLIPKFGKMLPEHVDHFVVVQWLDDLKRENKLSSQTQRHLLSTLSRFFSWLSFRKKGIDNPVRKVPTKSRPDVKHAQREWLQDESVVPKLMGELEKRSKGLGLMFALGNRSGLRLGEIAGLRISDLDHISDGYITVSRSYGGALKEDDGKDNVRRVKNIPAPIGAAKVLGPHLRERRVEGAGPDDLVFVPLAAGPKRGKMRRGPWRGYTKEGVHYHWVRACKALGLVDADGWPTHTWYGCTRHSAASRAKNDGLSPIQIAEALGHADTSMVKKFYFGSGTETTKFDPRLRLEIPTLKKKAG